jgi:putative redox protein
MGSLANAVESYGQWLAEDEQRGEISFSVSCESLGGPEVAVEVGHHTIRADEPKSLGGGGTAPTPVGYLIAALGSCVAIGLSYWSDILDIPFDSARVVVEGKINPAGAYALQEGVSPTFSDMRIEIRVLGSEPRDQYEELVATTASYSPLLETFKRPMPVPTFLTVSRPTAPVNPAE